MLKNNVHNSQQETCNVVFRFYVTSDCQHQPHTCFMTVVGACVGSIREGLKDFIYLEECGHYTGSNLQLRHNLQSFFQGQSSIPMSTTSPPNMRMPNLNTCNLLTLLMKTIEKYIVLRLVSQSVYCVDV